MSIILKKAGTEDIKTIWEMQKTAFQALLDKYQDYETNPANESLERLTEKFGYDDRTFYYITDNNVYIGVICVVCPADGSPKRISPLFIMPEYRRKGYAEAGVSEAERLYGADNWSLATILQEEGNIRLYEKLGYHRVGDTKKINERMDLVFFEK